MSLNDEHTLGDILRSATQPAIETPRVDKILLPFDNTFRTTADLCLTRAIELEQAAADLRVRAEALHNARDLITEVKNAVEYEISARHRAQSLSLVNPDRDD